jgi:hypothetical protein
MPDDTQRLAAIVRRLGAVCDSLHRAALQGDWPGVVRLGARQARLARLLQSASRSGLPNAALRAQLRDAQTRLEAAMALAEQQKETLLRQIQGLRTGQRALALYHHAEHLPD